MTIKTISEAATHWHYVPEGDPVALQQLAKQHAFHALDIEDCLAENQRPKVDEYPRYLFIVLHAPIYSKHSGRIKTAEVDIFIGQKFLVTVDKHQLPLFEELISKSTTKKNRQQLLGSGTGYALYHIISRMQQHSFSLLDGLWRNANTIEKNVFAEDANRDVLKDILKLQRNITTFRRIVQPLRAVVASLEHRQKKFLTGDVELYLDDLVDGIEKLWASLTSLREVAEALQNANESIIARRTGNTIRVLTVFSVLLLPLTLITGFFGMNVALPGSEAASAGLIILLAMLLMTAGLLLYFKSRDWI